MKKIIIFILLLLIIVSPAFARKGVGMVIHTEAISVNEESQKCITYGVFNPWDEDVMVYLDTKGEINDIITKEETQPQLIKAETTDKEARELELCFHVPKVYKGECILGLACKQTCLEEKEYKGEVIAVEFKGENEGSTGSSTSLGISSPLTIKVSCQPKERSWSQIYSILVIIAILAILLLLYRKYKK